MSDTIRVKIVLLFGDQAEVTADAHDAAPPQRYPAATIAQALGVTPRELPGMRLLADVDDTDCLTNWRLP